MKYIFSILIIILSSFIPIKAQDINFNSYFFDNQVTFYSLSNFIGTNNIIVFDENKKITAIETQYKNQNESVSQEIQITHSIPTVEKYLILSDYIINDNLAVISFANSDKKRYIIYTLKRRNKNEKWWTLLSIYDSSMN